MNNSSLAAALTDYKEAPSLVIVMPAYNEEGCIYRVVESWLALFARLDIDKNLGRLIVVNDGSKDNTGRILDALAAKNSFLKVVHQANAGHGAALLRGYQEAIKLNYGWVFHVDSDDQFKTEDFHKLWNVRQSSQFILGHRKQRSDPFHRLVITHINRFLNLFLYGCHIPDANVPYRLIRTEYLKKLLTVIPPDVFAPNIFLSVLAKKHGMQLGNHPVVHEQRRTGTISIVKWRLIKVCFRTAKELLLFRRSLTSQVKKLNQ